jgi:hypothetical protein
VQGTSHHRGFSVSLGGANSLRFLQRTVLWNKFLVILQVSGGSQVIISAFFSRFDLSSKCLAISSANCICID